jgi:hypothetical protein
MNPGNQRLKIKKFEVMPDKTNQHRVRVTLMGKEKDFIGERSGEGGENALLALAAQATLDAILSATIKPIKLELKGINSDETFEDLSESLIIVAVSINDGKSEMVMPGSCRVQGDKVEAAVKATLDATNRVTELFL